MCNHSRGHSLKEGAALVSRFEGRKATHAPTATLTDRGTAKRQSSRVDVPNTKAGAVLIVEDADLPRAPTAAYCPGPGMEVPRPCFVTAGCFSGAATIAQLSLRTHASQITGHDASSGMTKQHALYTYRVDVPNFALGAEDLVLVTCSPKPDVVAYWPGPGFPVEFAFLHTSTTRRLRPTQPRPPTNAARTTIGRHEMTNQT
jgi:hypothetical protein